MTLQFLALLSSSLRFRPLPCASRSVSVARWSWDASSPRKFTSSCSSRRKMSPVTVVPPTDSAPPEQADPTVSIAVQGNFRAVVPDLSPHKTPPTGHDFICALNQGERLGIHGNYIIYGKFPKYEPAGVTWTTRLGTTAWAQTALGKGWLKWYQGVATDFLPGYRKLKGRCWTCLPSLQFYWCSQLL